MEDPVGCRLAAKTARPRREGGLGLDWGVAARRLEEFVDSGEILAPEPVRGGHAIKLLRGRRDSDRDPFLACGVDREGEILGHQVGHEAGRVLPARSGTVDNAGDRMHVFHDPGGAGGFGRFRKRSVVLDSSPIDTLLVIPL